MYVVHTHASNIFIGIFIISYSGLYHGVWASPWQPFDVPQGICNHNLLPLWQRAEEERDYSS